MVQPINDEGWGPLPQVPEIEEPHKQPEVAPFREEGIDDWHIVEDILGVTFDALVAVGAVYSFAHNSIYQTYSTSGVIDTPTELAAEGVLLMLGEFIDTDAFWSDEVQTMLRDIESGAWDFVNSQEFEDTINHIASFITISVITLGLGTVSKLAGLAGKAGKTGIILGGAEKSKDEILESLRETGVTGCAEKLGQYAELCKEIDPEGKAADEPIDREELDNTVAEIYGTGWPYYSPGGFLWGNKYYQRKRRRMYHASSGQAGTSQPDSGDAP